VSDVDDKNEKSILIWVGIKLRDLYRTKCTMHINLNKHKSVFSRDMMAHFQIKRTKLLRIKLSIEKNFTDIHFSCVHHLQEWDFHFSCANSHAKCFYDQRTNHDYQCHQSEDVSLQSHHLQLSLFDLSEFQPRRHDIVVCLR
jgi:hypothetical protein